MRAKLSKAQRESVRVKFGGKCAYCGVDLDAKFNVDHMSPVCRAHMQRNFDVNAMSNLMPSCFSCNNYKMSYDLEGFRRQLEDQVRMARAYSVNFRLAERFGMIQVVSSKVNFYFERMLTGEDNNS